MVFNSKFTHILLNNKIKRDWQQDSKSLSFGWYFVKKKILCKIFHFKWNALHTAGRLFGFCLISD